MKQLKFFSLRPGHVRVEIDDKEEGLIVRAPVFDGMCKRAYIYIESNRMKHDPIKTPKISNYEEVKSEVIKNVKDKYGEIKIA